MYFFPTVFVFYLRYQEMVGAGGVMFVGVCVHTPVISVWQKPLTARRWSRFRVCVFVCSVWKGVCELFLGI